jgi:class 3 adenylate cyclase
MLARFQSSLRYKISAQMLLLSLVPLAIVGVAIYVVLAGQLGVFSDRLGETEEALRSDVVGANLAGNADTLAAEIDSYMLERIRDVRRWAEAPEVVAVVRQANQVALTSGLATADRSVVEPALDAQAEDGKSPYFLALDGTEVGQQLGRAAINYLFSQQEKTRGTFLEVIVTEASGINVLVTRPVTERFSRDAQWWLDARLKGVAGIGIVDANLDADSQRIVVGIALPVVDPDSKEVLGVIRGVLNLSEIQLLVSRRAALIPGGQMQLLTSNGDLLADTASQDSLDVLLNPATNQLTQGYDPAVAALQAEALPGFEVLSGDSENGAVVVGYSRTRGSGFYDEPAGLSGFPGFSWGVTVSQPEETALQVLTPLLDARQTLARQSGVINSVIIGAASLTAVAGLIVALLLARGITNPLVDLSRVTEQVRAGEYGIQVEVTSQDEVGTLQDGFNLMVRGLDERERMRDLFGRAVSPEVAEHFLSGGLELGGEVRQVTILFSDIRGFTTLSEPLSPEQVIAFVNEFLDEMHQAIQGVGGIVHKLGGDSIMALFGAPVANPDSPRVALRAALRMRARLAALNERRRARGDVPLRIGIGVNTGPVVAGGVGSEDRLEYTVLGDAVNVAARLESLTKEFPQHDILISETTLQALPDRDQVEMVDLGEIKVKGKTEPVRIFGVLDYHGAIPESPLQV